jgi:hypothetical protein
MNSTMYRCSFCRESGHNIKNCNDGMLFDFRDACLGNRIIFGYEEDSQQKFYNWLNEKETTIIKAFGARFCKIKRNDKERISKIVNYIYNFTLDEIYEIINPENERLMSYVLSDVLSLRGLLFDERINITFTALENLLNIRNVIPEKLNISTTLTILETRNENILEECSICYDSKNKKDFVDFNCQHNFCGECVLSTIKTKTSSLNCPLCRGQVKNIMIHNPEIQSELKKYIL